MVMVLFYSSTKDATGNVMAASLGAISRHRMRCNPRPPAKKQMIKADVTVAAVPLIIGEHFLPSSCSARPILTTEAGGLRVTGEQGARA